MEFNNANERNLQQAPSNGRLRSSYVWKDNEEIIGKKKNTLLFVKCVQYVLYTSDESLGMMDRGDRGNGKRAEKERLTMWNSISGITRRI